MNDVSNMPRLSRKDRSNELALFQSLLVESCEENKDFVAEIARLQALVDRAMSSASPIDATYLAAAFLDGAQFWKRTKTGAAMKASDRKVVMEEAARRYCRDRKRPRR